MFLKYRELGLSLIPLAYKSKRPVGEMTEWQRFSEDLPTIEECERWERLYKPCNYGLVLGPCSGIIVVDIDDPNFKDCAPPSPMVRLGKPGREQRFFRWSEQPNLNITVPGERAAAIQILGRGKYTVLPPSIHPDTDQPFMWSSQQTLENTSCVELPYLLESDILKMREAIERVVSQKPKSSALLGEVKVNTDPSRESPTGSHDAIKAFAATLIAQRSPLDVAVNKLLEYDERFHKPKGYFQDPTRGADASADAYSNAACFYANLLKSINKKRIRENEPVQIPEYEEITISHKVKRPEVIYPKPGGVLASIVELSDISSATTSTKQLSLGGALSLLSVLAANRVWAKVDQFVITPNLYVLNLAPSGAGKDGPQRIVTSFLTGMNLLGPANYRSGSAMIQNLPNQQNRIDVIDEASGFFKAMGDKNSYQSEMAEILCNLFSAASSEYGGAMAATKGKDPIGACIQPHVSILASTTPAGFRDAVSRELATKGLLPRFLTFYERSKGKLNDKFDTVKAESLRRSIDGFIKAFVMRYELTSADNKAMLHKAVSGFQPITKGVQFNPTIFKFSDAAAMAWHSYREAIFMQSNDTDGETFDEAFKNRFGELAAKIALLHAISTNKESIELEDIQWAIAVVDLQWANCEDVFELAKADSKHHRICLHLKRIIKDAGGVINRRDLSRKSQMYPDFERKGAIQVLIDSGEIMEDPLKKEDGKVTMFYKICGGPDSRHASSHLNSRVEK